MEEGEADMRVGSWLRELSSVVAVRKVGESGCGCGHGWRRSKMAFFVFGLMSWSNELVGERVDGVRA